MIGRKHRFHGHNSLNFLFRRGQTLRAEFMSLRYSSGKYDDYRLAVVVSKKVSKSSVVRNRIRRRIYEVVRSLHKETGSQWPSDMSITVYDVRIAEMPYAKLEQSIKKLLQKAGVM